MNNIAKWSNVKLLNDAKFWVCYEKKKRKKETKKWWKEKKKLKNEKNRNKKDVLNRIRINK